MGFGRGNAPCAEFEAGLMGSPDGGIPRWPTDSRDPRESLVGKNLKK